MNASTPVSWDVPEDQIVRSSRGRGWVGLDGAEVVHAECDFTVPALDQHIVVFNLGER